MKLFQPGLSHLFLLACLLLMSCQKEVEDILSPSGGSGTGTGTNSRDSYNPTTTGTWWKHKDSASGTISTSTIVNRTKTANSVVYMAMVGTNGTITDTGWIASPRPNYYLYQKGVSPNTGAAYDMMFHYLNDTAAAGYNWQYIAGQGNGFTAHIDATIVERNISMTVSGKLFTNVIHTRLVLSYDVFGSAMEAMGYDYYLAKGVGIIKVRSEGLGLLSGFKACTDIVDYSIK